MSVNLYDWCKNNNVKLLSEWDHDLNENDMNAFTYRSGLYAYWVCSKCNHRWKSKICNRTNGSGCPMCNNNRTGQRTINKSLMNGKSLFDVSPVYLSEWDYDKNVISPKEITISSNKKVWWKCVQCGHSYNASPNARTRGTGCILCGKVTSNNKKILKHIEENGSFADLHPDFIEMWDKSNTKSCHEVTENSTYIAKWKCKQCGHQWERSITNMSKSTGCPMCMMKQFSSTIQNEFVQYITTNYNYNILHEHNCSIVPKNPKTGHFMPYDNEIIINDKHLIIEVNGEQHYCITNYTQLDAKKMNKSPEDMLEYQKWKDRYKKDYAISCGYYYLELPYWVFKNELYKKIIDDKIYEIINNNKLVK